MFGRKDWESLLRPDKLSVESEFGQSSPIPWYSDRTHCHHTPGARRTSSNACAKCKQSGDTKHGSSGVLKRSVIRSGVWGLLLCWLTRLHSRQPTHTHTVCSGNFRMLYSLESLESYVSFRIVLALNESIDASSTKIHKNHQKTLNLKGKVLSVILEAPASPAGGWLVSLGHRASQLQRHRLSKWTLARLLPCKPWTRYTSTWTYWSLPFQCCWHFWTIGGRIGSLGILPSHETPNLYYR